MLYYVAGFAANNVNVVFGEGKGNIAVASAWNSHLDKVRSLELSAVSLF